MIGNNFLTIRHHYTGAKGGEESRVLTLNVSKIIAIDEMGLTSCMVRCEEEKDYLVRELREDLVARIECVGVRHCYDGTNS